MTTLFVPCLLSLQLGQLYSNSHSIAPHSAKPHVANPPPSVRLIHISSTPESCLERHKEKMLNAQGLIRNCYKRALKTDQSLQGKITIQFGVGNQTIKHPIDIKSNTISNENLFQCLKIRLMHLQPGCKGTLNAIWSLKKQPKK